MAIFGMIYILSGGGIKLCEMIFLHPIFKDISSQRGFLLVALLTGLILITYGVLIGYSELKKHLRESLLSACYIWWAHTDLNCGPTDYESAALTN